MKKFFYIIAVLALGITACNKNEVPAPADEPAASVTAAAEAPVYHFSIPASIGKDANTKAVTIGESTIENAFADADKVYVFMERSGTLAAAHNGTDALTYLTPSGINGATCTLEGALKFYYNDNGDFAAFEPAVNDVVRLFYNLNQPYAVYAIALDQSSFYFGNNGSKDSHPDEYSWGAALLGFAEARMKVTAVSGNGTDGYTLTMVQYDDPSKGNVHFNNITSMFRQRLSFTDQNSQPIAIPTVSELRINMEGGVVIDGYYPLKAAPADFYPASPKTIQAPVISAEGDVYLAMMFNDDNKNLPLVLEAVDEDENVYSVTKAAPTGGFENGKYYYGSATLAWQKSLRPTVTGTSATPINVGPYRRYYVEEDPVGFTISGNCEGYCFEISEGHGGTVTLDNVTATTVGTYGIFLAQEYNDPTNADISLVLTGTNSIVSDWWGINVYGNLKLSCTGASATLTVTTGLDGPCGIECNNYTGQVSPSDPEWNYCDDTGERDVTALLAADGFTVIRSARTDNPGGSYTWTYTVIKNTLGKFSVSDTQQVFFSPGNLQATTTDNGTNWTWAFAVHQWDYIGDDVANYSINGDGTVEFNGTVDLFGWVGSSSSFEPYGINDNGIPDNYGSPDESLKSDWGNTITDGYSWRTPSSADWHYLFVSRESGSTVNGTSNARWAHATINSDNGTGGVNGIILFPDGVTIATGEATSWGNINVSSTWAACTKCTIVQWIAFAARGCVFLPAAGNRDGPTVFDVNNTEGYYWSSTTSYSLYVYSLSFSSDNLTSMNNNQRFLGFSVRLVRDVPVAP